jgi:hypothetical protein
MEPNYRPIPEPNYEPIPDPRRKTKPQIDRIALHRELMEHERELKDQIIDIQDEESMLKKQLRLIRRQLAKNYKIMEKQMNGGGLLVPLN